MKANYSRVPVRAMKVKHRLLLLVMIVTCMYPPSLCSSFVLSPAAPSFEANIHAPLLVRVRVPASNLPSSLALSIGDINTAANQQDVLTDLSIAVALSTFTDPIVRKLFNATQIRNSNLDEVDFRDTVLFCLADAISASSRLFAGLLLVDLLIEIFAVEEPPFQADLGVVAPKVALCIWVAMTVSAVKRTVFLQGVSGTSLGRVSLYDKLIDFLLGVVTVAIILDLLEYDLAIGLQWLVAGSGTGALIFSLASKDLASAILGGFIVQAWDAFDEGDDIRLGDGTQGSVKKIGLVETEIVGYDGIPLRIPNSQLTNARVSNLSRMQKSRVYQVLRFSYSDLEILPQVLCDIKAEIEASCPKLITDGSKPFRATLTSYQADCVEATVNCHFTIPEMTGEYVDNRQEVLLAISRALEKNNVHFALPSILYRTRKDEIGSVVADDEGE